MSTFNRSFSSIYKNKHRGHRENRGHRGSKAIFLSFSVTSVFSVLSVLVCFSNSFGADVQDRIDWPKFLSRHDLVFNQITEKWGEGAFTGNGLMGVMLYLTDDKTGLRFRVGRSDVMIQERQAYRVPIGDLVLRPVGKITGGNMRMDLWNAEVTGTLRTDKGEISFRTFTHSNHPLQIIELK